MDGEHGNGSDREMAMTLPTVIVPGYFAQASEYEALERDLNAQGIPTVTVPLRKWDWVPTLGGRSVVPILRRLDVTVQQVLQHHQASRINLVGHSAGGWIARIYLGDRPYDIHGDVAGEAGTWHGHQQVATLVTLGTPHISQERWTKRNLDFVKETYPGAYFDQVHYVCVAGKAIFGQRRLGHWLAYNSYRLTCGVGNCWGDGIIPVTAAHLPGATNLMLKGIRHAPNALGDWYGSPQVQSAWIKYLNA